MNRYSFATLVLISSSLASWRAFAGPDDALSDASRKVLVEAVDAANRSDWATCRIKMAGLWDKQRDFRIAGFLGLCEVELGMFKEGAEHLDFYTAHDDGSDPARTQKIQPRFERAKREVASVKATSNVANARILVDGRVVGDAPLTLFLLPGSYRVSAEKDGLTGAAIEVVAEKGASREVSLRLEARVAPSSTATPTATAAPSSTVAPSQPFPVWPAGLAYGVAGAGALLGGGMLIGAAVRDSDAETVAQTCKTPFSQSGCAVEGQGALDDAAAFRTVSVLGWVVAGAGLAVAIPLSIAAGQDGDADVEASLAPIVTPELQGFVFQTHF